MDPKLPPELWALVCDSVVDFDPEDVINFCLVLPWCRDLILLKRWLLLEKIFYKHVSIGLLQKEDVYCRVLDVDFVEVTHWYKNEREYQKGDFNRCLGQCLKMTWDFYNETKIINFFSNREQKQHCIDILAMFFRSPYGEIDIIFETIVTCALRDDYLLSLLRQAILPKEKLPNMMKLEYFCFKLQYRMPIMYFKDLQDEIERVGKRDNVDRSFIRSLKMTLNGKGPFESESHLKFIRKLQINQRNSLDEI